MNTKTTRDDLIQIFKQKTLGFDPETPLDRQFNSIDLFDMVLVIEKHFGIQFYSIELTTENFKSLEALAAIIDKRRST